MLPSIKSCFDSESSDEEGDRTQIQIFADCFQFFLNYHTQPQIIIINIRDFLVLPVVNANINFSSPSGEKITSDTDRNKRSISEGKTNLLKKFLCLIIIYLY